MGMLWLSYLLFSISNFLFKKYTNMGDNLYDMFYFHISSALSVFLFHTQHLIFAIGYLKIATLNKQSFSYQFSATKTKKHNELSNGV